MWILTYGIAMEQTYNFFKNLLAVQLCAAGLTHDDDPAMEPEKQMYNAGFRP